MTLDEFVDKFLSEYHPAIMLQARMELKRIIIEAIASHKQAQWKTYPENVPEKKGRYQITTSNIDRPDIQVGTALWKNGKWWMDDDENDGFLMGLRDDFILAFRSLPKPYKPTEKGNNR